MKIGKSFGTFTLETNIKKFHGFSELVLDKNLECLKNGTVEHIIIIPDEVLGGCSFIQTCPDRNEGEFHLEVSIVDGDLNILYGNEPYSIDEIRDIFIDYLENGTVPDVDGWELIGKFQRS